jgi:hypothetical protein
MDSPTKDENRSPASFADFSAEEEPGGWLKTLVQFFAIPMLIVVMAVGVFFGVSLMIGSGPKSAADFAELLQSDTVTRRWHAAFELSARLKDGVPDELRDPKLVAALGSALERARKENQDPPKMAVTTLLLLGRIGDSGSIPVVRDALTDRHPWVRSYAVTTLATLGDLESRDAILKLAEDKDPSTRQAALAALATLEQREGIPYHLSPELRAMLKQAVGDREEDVRFTAALLLANVNDRHSALPVLKTMLDRDYLEKIVPNERMDTRLSGISRYRVHSNVIFRGLDAVERLDCSDDEEVVAAVRKLSDSATEGDSDVRYRAQKLLTRWKKQQGA